LFEISGHNAENGLVAIIGSVTDPASELRLTHALARIDRAIALDDRPALARNLPDMMGSVSMLLGSLPPNVSRDYKYLWWPKFAPALARVGEVARAESMLRELPANCYPCAVSRGDVAASKGDKAGAIRWFEQAKSLGPSLPFADEALGRMHLAADDLNAAERAFERATSLEPRYADALRGSGDVLARRRVWREAAKQYAAAARQAPRWGGLHLHWANALRRSGDGKRAREVLRSTGSMILSPADLAVRERLRRITA